MKNTQKVNKNELRAIKTRNKLLQAAREIFIEHGYEKATITQIIKKAKTGYGTAYVYFKGKDDILIVLMEDVMKDFYNIAEMQFTPKTVEEALSRIRLQSEKFFQFAIEQQDMLQIFEEAIGFSQEARSKWVDIRERFIKRIEQDIDYSQRNHLARKDLNTELTARSWFFLHEMYLWELVKNNRNYTVNEIVENLFELYTKSLYVNGP